jgi:hypothetical protein
MLRVYRITLTTTVQRNKGHHYLGDVADNHSHDHVLTLHGLRSRCVDHFYTEGTSSHVGLLSMKVYNHKVLRGVLYPEAHTNRPREPLTFKVFGLLRKNRPHLRETGCNSALEWRRTAICKSFSNKLIFWQGPLTL